MGVVVERKIGPLDGHLTYKLLKSNAGLNLLLDIGEHAIFTKFNNIFDKPVPEQHSLWILVLDLLSQYGKHLVRVLIREHKNQISCIAVKDLIEVITFEQVF